jgi:hypothetical protein
LLPIDPVRTSRPVRCGHPCAAVAIVHEYAVGKIHPTRQVTSGADRSPRGHAAEKTQLALEHIADAGKVALVEQCGTDGSVRIRAKSTFRFCGIPVRPEEVRSEVLQNGGFFLWRQDIEHREVVSHCAMRLRSKDHSDE